MENTITLKSGAKMPMLGLGVYNISDPDADAAVSAAIRAGYRLVDTAPVYKNEEAIGHALAKSGISREELFLTSKIWNTAQRMGDIDGAFSRSLDRLGVGYVDLYLIHWPVPGCYTSTFREMEKLLSSGRTKAIGVSNFGIYQLEQVESATGILPAVNQIEVHPLCYPKELIEYCQSRGIAVQAYAPLARGAYFDHDILCVLATKYAKTPAQIGLRWLIQKGISVIPKSADPAHIALNADLWSFSLEPSDIAYLDTLNENLHTSGFPEDLREVLRWDEGSFLVRRDPAAP